MSLRTPTHSGDARSPGLLADELLRCAQGHAWPLSQTRVARGSSHGDSNGAGKAEELEISAHRKGISKVTPSVAVVLLRVPAKWRPAPTSTTNCGASCLRKP